MNLTIRGVVPQETLDDLVRGRDAQKQARKLHTYVPIPKSATIHYQRLESSQVAK